MGLTLTIPDAIDVALKIPDAEKEKRLMLELAVSLYKSSILSFGKARNLANLSKWEFHEELGKRKIERHYNMTSFMEDLKYGQG